jgi:hypothetical protein
MEAYSSDGFLTSSTLATYEHNSCTVAAILLRVIEIVVSSPSYHIRMVREDITA